MTRTGRLHKFGPDGVGFIQDGQTGAWYGFATRDSEQIRLLIGRARLPVHFSTTEDGKVGEVWLFREAGLDTP